MQLRNMMLAALFTTLMIISSYVVVPIGPVPHTLQPLVVFLTGLLLGHRWGAISISVWVVLGIIGLPVFNQGQAGAVMLVGPTGGFIIGFVVCAWLIGLLTEGDLQSGYARTFGCIVLGLAVAYILGFIGFKFSFQYFLQKPMSWEKSFWIVIAPFLPFDIIKAAIATYVGINVRKALIAADLYIGGRK